LGPFGPDEWVALAHSDEPIACHQTIDDDYDESEAWDAPGIKQCAGAAIYRANVCKSPRDPEVARGEVDRETVFATPTEFKEHHHGV
jgi:hypothetical protein